MIERYAGILPFLFSILLELFSPVVTGYFNANLDTYLDDLDDDQIGPDAESSVKEFGEYSFEILQMYTALAITFFSALYQLLFGEQMNPVLTVLLLLGILYFVYTMTRKDALQDPHIHGMLSERYSYSPSSLITIAVNLAFIAIIVL